MERFVYKKIRLKDISREFPYACRYGSRISALKDSLARHGLFSPVVVLEKQGKAGTLLAGHARFRAACELNWGEISAMAVQAEKKDSDWYLFSLLSNWNQVWNDLDRAFAIARALQFGFGEQAMQKDILPALGLAPEKKWLGEAREVMALAPEILDAVCDGMLPYRGVRALAVFSAQDQRVFAKKIAGTLSLTSNQLLKAAEWIYDLMKAQKKDLSAILELPVLRCYCEPKAKPSPTRAFGDDNAASSFPHVLGGNPREDRRSKAERFYDALRSQRFPEQVRREQKFASAAERLAQESRLERNDFVLEAPPSFEAEGLTLRARLKNPQALDRIMEVIERKRNLFNSLFDIVL